MKYGNKKVLFNNIVFDSKKEAMRYQELLILQRVGKIEHLELQKEFELIPAQYDKPVKRGRGKCLERACKYKADFYYFDKEKKCYVCEDVKGYKGGGAYAVFTVKRKLMLYIHGIQIVEV